MSNKIQSGKTRILLVEGKSEIEFFVQLGFHINFSATTPLQIIGYDGKHNLQNILALLQADNRFIEVTHIGIIRDADFDENSFQSVQSALTYANSKNPTRPQFPDVEALCVFVGEKPVVGVFIMPDDSSNGMLESLILRSLSEDQIMECVDSYFECLENKNIIPKPEPYPKAAMRVYMTALYQGKMRAYIEGKNVDVESIGSDKDKSYLSDIYKMTWWDWDHPAFDDIKAFIRELVGLQDSADD